MTERVVLIGLDGATFTILDHLMREGVMPFLKGFVESGTRAEMCSVVPPLTPPAWTSLATGRSPGHHGVFDFFRPVAPGSPHIRMTTSRDVGCETIWSMVSRHGLKVTCLNYPVTFPPPPINGFVVSGGWMPWRQLRLGCHPADLYDRLTGLPGFSPRELAMDAALEEKAVDGCREEEYEDWVRLHIRRDLQWFEVLKHLMGQEACELTAIVFDGVDKIQHLCWRFLDPECLQGPPSQSEQSIRELCLEYFRSLDQVLSDIVSTSGPDATIVIASDHGFGQTSQVFYVNAWLEQQGYLAWTKRGDPQEQPSESLGFGQLARHVYQLDWRRTKAYVATPSSNGIHIVVARDEGDTGVPIADYHEFASQLAAALYAVTYKAGDKPVVSRVWTREEAFPGPYQELAPSLTLSLGDGGLVSILPSDVPVKQRRELRGSHRSEGVLIVRGPGIGRGAILPQLSILDVAPLVLHCLGLPIPEQFEGHLPVEAFTRLGPTGRKEGDGQTALCPENRERDDDGPGLSREDEAEIARRLRVLGYLE